MGLGISTSLGGGDRIAKSFHQASGNGSDERQREPVFRYLVRILRSAYERLDGYSAFDRLPGWKDWPEWSGSRCILSRASLLAASSLGKRLPLPYPGNALDSPP